MEVVRSDTDGTFLKRLFDLSIAGGCLFALSPILLAISVLVFFKLGKPVVFAQVRPGLYGKPFTLYKFRTMKDLHDESGRLLPDETRLTPFGIFLRKYSLDELPQLWNVLKGDISLVGPRPLLLEYMPLYSREQARRHDVKPGITGWAQVNGRNSIDWDRKFEFDLWYVENQSFWLDLKILWLTVLKVMRSEGINAQGYATVPDFTGSQSKHATVQEEGS